MSATRALPFRCSAAITKVDGTTLVDEPSRLTSRAISAVAELRAMGIVFPVITSRPPSDIARRAGRARQCHGRCQSEVRPAAGFVTDDSREEGFADAVERFVLGGGRASKRTESTRAGVRAW
jgi:hypothetical protein